MKRHLLTIITIALVGASSVLAQVGEPLYFTFTAGEAIFPSGMVFRANASLDPNIEISSLTLLVQPETAPAVQFDIPQDDEDIFQRDGRLLTLNYIWQFDTAPEVPDLFTDVSFTWRLVTPDGTTDMISDTIEYRDVRTRWINETDADMNINLYYVRDEFSGFRFFNALRPAYERIQGRTQPINPPTIIVYDRSVESGCGEDENGAPVATAVRFALQIPCDPMLTEDIFARSERLILIRERAFSDRVSRVMQELITQFYAPIWAEGDLPEWFRLGVIHFYDPTSQIGLKSVIEFESLGGQLLTFEEMQTTVREDNDDYDLFRAQGFGLVVYMAQLFGVDAVDELAETIDQYPTFEIAYESVMRAPLEALYPAWQTWVLTDEALSAFALNIYLGATPTPTTVPSATLTDTPLPTLTPTNTPTITLTPSDTPTATRVPPTPTLTPISARDFFTPTPTSTPIPSLIVIDADAQTLRSLFLGVIGGAAILLILGIAMNRNRS